MTTRVLVPSGVLGLGFDHAALERGLRRRPHIMAIDGGSTDSGPFYLGQGVSKYSRHSTFMEWLHLLKARERACVPLVIGSAGTCGTDSMVKWMLDITREAAHVLKKNWKVAAVRCSQHTDSVAEAFEAGRLHPLNPEIRIEASDIRSCSNIVALAGVEQMRAALELKPDIVIAGRATDTAAIAVLPLMRGECPAASWHAAKVSECGALCSTDPLSGVVMVEVDREGFTIAAMGEQARCTPHTVAAHMLYENADPNLLYEPGGHLDAAKANYSQKAEGMVRVTGSDWTQAENYSVKLEGSRESGYQTTLLATVRDRKYVMGIRGWAKSFERFAHSLVARRINLSEPAYSLELRLIGVNSVLGRLENRKTVPAEVGILVIVTAKSQETASEIARLLNPFLLHFPLEGAEELPTHAYPYSPAESERGQVYEFVLNHILVLDDPLEAFAIDLMEVGHGSSD